MTGPTQTWLIELSTEHCEELLRTTTLGRLGVVAHGRPMIFPICHVYVDGLVAFPTNVGTKQRAALDWPFVAYEVDGVDPDGQSAWSVMVAGHAEVATPEQETRLRQVRDVPWRNSPELHWLVVVPTSITGRRILGPVGASP